MPTSPAPRPPPSLPAFAALVALLVAYLFTVPLAAARHGDFVHLWVAGRLVATGQTAALYSPEAHRALLVQTYGAVPEDLWMSRFDLLGVVFYPPPGAALYAPLGLLAEHTAAGLMAVLNVGLALLCAGLLARICRPRLGLTGGALVLLLFPSTFFTYVLGQNGLVSLALLLGSAALLLGGRDLAGGVVLGLLLYKPSWLLAAGWLPLVLRRWRALPGLVLGAAAAALAGAALTGLQGWEDWLHLAPRLAHLDALPDYPLALQHDLLSLPRRWLGIGASSTALGWSAAALVVGVSLWRGRHLAPARAVGLGLAAAVLVNPHVHHYDMLPSAAALAIALSGWRDLDRRGRIGLVALAAVHHLAFLGSELLDLGAVVSLPALATLGLWAWLGFGPGAKT